MFVLPKKAVAVASGVGGMGCNSEALLLLGLALWLSTTKYSSLLLYHLTLESLLETSWVFNQNERKFLYRGVVAGDGGRWREIGGRWREHWREWREIDGRSVGDGGRSAGAEGLLST